MTNLKLVKSKPPSNVAQQMSLLTGKPYVLAERTDVVRTFKQHGWVPPSQKGGKK